MMTMFLARTCRLPTPPHSIAYPICPGLTTPISTRIHEEARSYNRALMEELLVGLGLLFSHIVSLLVSLAVTLIATRIVTLTSTLAPDLASPSSISHLLPTILGPRLPGAVQGLRARAVLRRIFYFMQPWIFMNRHVSCYPWHLQPVPKNIRNVGMQDLCRKRNRDEPLVAQMTLRPQLC